PASSPAASPPWREGLAGWRLLPQKGTIVSVQTQWSEPTSASEQSWNEPRSEFLFHSYGYMQCTSIELRGEYSRRSSLLTLLSGESMSRFMPIHGWTVPLCSLIIFP